MRGKGHFGLLDLSQITGLCWPDLKPQCVLPDLIRQREWSLTVNDSHTAKKLE